MTDPRRVRLVYGKKWGYVFVTEPPEPGRRKGLRVWKGSFRQDDEEDLTYMLREAARYLDVTRGR